MKLLICWLRQHRPAGGLLVLTYNGQPCTDRPKVVHCVRCGHYVPVPTTPTLGAL